MFHRHEFVLKALSPGANLSALCREYGVTRATGYKWVARYREKGFRGLEELSRGPLRGQSPLSCSADVAVQVLSLRQSYPHYGARKLRAVLLRELPSEEVPSARTIGRILERAGLARHRTGGRRRTSGPTESPSLDVLAPNDVWSVDFKGWWRTKTRQKVDPLTVQDRYSRYLLAVRLVSRPSVEEVQGVFIELFKRYGVPGAIQSDGGPPFAATSGVIGLTRLSAWWEALGIRWHRSRPGCPQDNGGHERMHRDMAQELERHPAWDLFQQQNQCDRWRHEFNDFRPHEGLGMQTPASVYRPSHRAYSAIPVELTYPDSMIRRRVSTAGTTRYLGRQQYLSSALAGYHVGFEPLPDKGFRVWLRDRPLAEGTVPWTGPLRAPDLT